MISTTSATAMIEAVMPLLIESEPRLGPIFCDCATRSGTGSAPAFSTSARSCASASDLQDLALVLKAGALPVPLRVAQSQKIGPSLGSDSINKGITASVIAVTLVVLIMLVYYRFSG